MNLEYYATSEGIITTKSSRDRPHFEYRKKVQTVDKYQYTLSYGENFYTLSAVVFGTDALWWILSDINKSKDVFSYDVGDVIYLPGKLVDDAMSKRIY